MATFKLLLLIHSGNLAFHAHISCQILWNVSLALEDTIDMSKGEILGAFYYA